MADGGWRMSDGGWVMADGGWRIKNTSGQRFAIVMKDFEEMEVWRDAQMLAEDVYRDFFKVNDYSFSDQIKRAVVSISNNVAEGAERTTSLEFARFLDIAKGSAGEVRSMYRLAQRLGLMQMKSQLSVVQSALVFLSSSEVLPNTFVVRYDVN